MTSTCGRALSLAPLVGLIVFLGVYPKPVLERIEPSVVALVEHVERAVPDFTEAEGPAPPEGDTEELIEVAEVAEEEAAAEEAAEEGGEGEGEPGEGESGGSGESEDSGGSNGGTGQEEGE